MTVALNLSRCLQQRNSSDLFAEFSFLLSQFWSFVVLEFLLIANDCCSTYCFCCANLNWINLISNIKTNAFWLARGKSIRITLFFSYLWKVMINNSNQWTIYLFTYLFTHKINWSRWKMIQTKFYGSHKDLNCCFPHLMSLSICHTYNNEGKCIFCSKVFFIDLLKVNESICFYQFELQTLKFMYALCIRLHHLTYLFFKFVIMILVFFSFCFRKKREIDSVSFLTFFPGHSILHGLSKQ